MRISAEWKIAGGVPLSSRSRRNYSIVAIIQDRLQKGFGKHSGDAAQKKPFPAKETAVV
jgi:hypothetical protein